METITTSPRASAANKFPSVECPSQVKRGQGRAGRAGRAGRGDRTEQNKNRTEQTVNQEARRCRDEGS